MMTVAPRRKDNNKKLAKVVSTKLSIEDYDHFMIYQDSIFKRNNR